MISVNDRFKVVKISLSTEDYYSLTQLYVPFIGLDGVSIYLCLNNLYKDELELRSFFDLIGMSSLKNFEQALNKLEAMGLLKHFKSEKGRIFNMIRPMNSNSFLSNSILATAFETQIGSTYYKELRSQLFSKIAFKGYSEVTKRFDEVFKNSSQKIDVNFSNGTYVDEIEIRNEKFDYLVFKMLFDEKIDFLDSKEFEKEIIKISFLYQLDEFNMKRAVINSLNNDNEVSLEDIKYQAGLIYQAKTDEAFASFTPKDAVVLEQKLTKEENDILEMCTTFSIANMLASLSGGKASVAELKDYNKLMDQTKLPIGVINLIILYLSMNATGQNMSYNYLEKVARNWMKAGVKTTVDALILMRSLNEVKPKKTKSKKEVTTPDWMKNEEVVDNSLSKEDLEKAMELKKKLFGGSND